MHNKKKGSLPFNRSPFTVTVELVRSKWEIRSRQNVIVLCWVSTGVSVLGWYGPSFLSQQLQSSKIEHSHNRKHKGSSLENPSDAAPEELTNPKETQSDWNPVHSDPIRKWRETWMTPPNQQEHKHHQPKPREKKEFQPESSHVALEERFGSNHGKRGGWTVTVVSTQ